MKVIEISIAKFDGSLSYRLLAEEFKGRIGQNALKDMLSEIDDQIVTYDDRQYLVNPGNGGRDPRRLEPVEFEAGIPVTLPEMVEVPMSYEI